MGVPRKHRLNLDSENGFSKRSAGFDGLGTSVMGKTRRIEELPQTVNQAVVNPGKAASLFSMTRLWAVFWVQLVLMLPALGLFLATPASLGTLYLLVLLAPVGLASSAYAALAGLALSVAARPRTGDRRHAGIRARHTVPVQRTGAGTGARTCTCAGGAGRGEWHRSHLLFARRRWRLARCFNAAASTAYCWP